MREMQPTAWLTPCIVPCLPLPRIWLYNDCSELFKHGSAIPKISGQLIQQSQKLIGRKLSHHDHPCCVPEIVNCTFYRESPALVNVAPTVLPYQSKVLFRVFHGSQAVGTALDTMRTTVAACTASAVGHVALWEIEHYHLPFMSSTYLAHPGSWPERNGQEKVRRWKKSSATIAPRQFKRSEILK